MKKYTYKYVCKHLCENQTKYLRSRKPKQSQAYTKIIINKML